MKYNPVLKIALAFYNVLFFCLQPILILRLLWRSQYMPLYRKRLMERFGIFKALEKKGAIWIHAVSLGEVNAAAILIRHLQQTLPEVPILITTMTATGSQRVQELFTDKVFHVYVPYDIPLWIQFFLQRTRPSLLVIMETEIWPNLLIQTAKAKIPILLANARLSDNSFKNYKKIKMLMRYLLSKFEVIMAQTQEDKKRFIELGASPQSISVVGNLKWDMQLDESLKIEAAKWKPFFANNLLLVAGSTHEGEEDIILESFLALKKEYPSLRLLLAPRHPERFLQVENLILQKNLSVVKYSQFQSASHLELPQTYDVFLLDVIGQLMTFYGLADITFVGGSLVPCGGHNLLEPAIWGKVILSGSNVSNFYEIASVLINFGAMIQVKDQKDFTLQCSNLLNNFMLKENYEKALQTCLNQYQGSVESHLKWIQKKFI